MKKLLFLAMMLVLSANVKADDTINSSLNLNNPDVRKCLVEATEAEGWKLMALYTNADEKLVMVFQKDRKIRTYRSR
jgi:hypothetical protein